MPSDQVPTSAAGQTATRAAAAAPVASAAPAAAADGRPMKFNAAPPPATIYSAEVALAAAAQAVEAANRAKLGVQNCMATSAAVSIDIFVAQTSCVILQVSNVSCSTMPS